MKNTFKNLSLIVVIFLINQTVNAAATAVDLRSEIQKIINTTAECKKSGDFYWEIGSASGTIVSDSVGKTFNANSEMEIASASKWLFSAYVFEKTKGQVTDEQKKLLQMHSGRTKLDGRLCFDKKIKTVEDCLKVKNASGKKNDAVASEEVGKFHYASGHGQALAVQPIIGLGSTDNKQLGEKIQSELKLKGEVKYVFPQLAAGAIASAVTYAEFLQNLLADKYYLSKAITTEPGVCANKLTCPKDTVVGTPVEKVNWWYGNHYWIEKSAEGKVEAYSSAGAYGFYPWITADKKYYGIISRKDEKDPIASIISVRCGKAMREKFLALNLPSNLPAKK